MSRNAEEYVEDRAARYPRATRSELIRDEYLDMSVNAAVSLVVYGAFTWALWFYASPDWAKGYGFACLGFVFSQIMENVGRIRAFKRLMPED